MVYSVLEVIQKILHRHIIGNTRRLKNAITFISFINLFLFFLNIKEYNISSLIYINTRTCSNVLKTVKLFKNNFTVFNKVV